MRGLCKLIANVSKERGEKKQPWQPEPGGPRSGLQKKPVSTLGGRIRRTWEKNTGKASRGVDGGKRQATASASSRHTTSQCIVRDMICNSGECEGFESRVSPSSPSSSSPWVFPPSRSLVPGWGNCVFLLNTIFPRDRGGQRHDQKAFILPAFLLMLGYLYRNGPLSTQSPTDTKAGP